MVHFGNFPYWLYLYIIDLRKRKLLGLVRNISSSVVGSQLVLIILFQSRFDTFFICNYKIYQKLTDGHLQRVLICIIRYASCSFQVRIFQMFLENKVHND